MSLSFLFHLMIWIINSNIYDDNDSNSNNGDEKSYRQEFFINKSYDTDGDLIKKKLRIRVRTRRWRRRRKRRMKKINNDYYHYILLISQGCNVLKQPTCSQK